MRQKRNNVCNQHIFILEDINTIMATKTVDRKQEKENTIIQLQNQIKKAQMTNIDKANLCFFLANNFTPRRYASYLLALIHLEWRGKYGKRQKASSKGR